MTFRVRSMQESDLATVLSWRNAPDVRRHLWTQHEIGIDEHCEWFRKSQNEIGRNLLIFEADRIPSGFVQFSKAGPGGVSDWGFYRAPSSPRGMGRAMGRTALGHAFDVLDLHKVCGQAIAGNEASRKFHLSLGFAEEGVLREQFYDGTSFHHVVVFGLLGRDWTTAMARPNE